MKPKMVRAEVVDLLEELGYRIFSVRDSGKVRCTAVRNGVAHKSGLHAKKTDAIFELYNKIMRRT